MTAPLKGPERVAYIVQRRSDRATFRQIGSELSISDTMVHRIFQRELDRHPAQQLNAHRAEQLDLLDRAVRGLLDMAENARLSARTRVESWRAIIAVEERRARLLRLDPPRQREVEVITVDAVDRELARLMEEESMKRAEAAMYGLDLSDIPPLQPSKLEGGHK